MSPSERGEVSPEPFRSGWLRGLAVALTLSAACSSKVPSPSPSTSSDAAAATDAQSTIDAASNPPALAWQRSILRLEPDGRTEPHTLHFPRLDRAFAVRSSLARPRSDHRVCFQLEEVSHGPDIWVDRASTDDYGDYCRTCRERVAPGSGYGFHVLPSGADDVPALDQVKLRVALRDCATLTPLSAAEADQSEIAVEHTSWVPPASATKLRLPLSIVVASEHAFTADEDLLPRALDTLRETWSAAGITIEITGMITIEVPPGPITYSATDRSQLIAVTRAVQAALDERGIARAWPVIVLGRCLRRDDVLAGGRSEPLAATPHIPGGFGLGDEADSILVAAERCEGLRPGPRFLDPQTLGAILAHELGHYLGLFHMEERDGRPDSLPDTAASIANLMQVMPNPTALTLTDSQQRVARRHPIFVSR